MIEWSQGFTSNGTKTLFSDWYENKKRFIRWFGEKLICELGEVEYHIDKDKRDTMIDDFLDQCSHIMSYSEYSDFYQFVKANKETFFKNLVSNETITLNRPVKKGMKLSKAFKFFIADKEMLIQVQQLASSYIQKDKVHGILCLSVHPLDYLSASENTYNWRSCHALDGEYRAGNLSYMTDDVTICCYIRGEDEVVLPHFPPSIKWNSKKWRMWIHLDSSMNWCFLGRQYPFTLDGIYTKIQETLPGIWEPFTDLILNDIEKDGVHYRLSDGHFLMGQGFDTYNVIKLKDFIKEGSKLNYNDLLYSSFYKPMYSSRKDMLYLPHHPTMTVGHKVKCLCCNREDIEPGDNVMVCYDCGVDLGLIQDGITCPYCGEVYREDDMYTLHDGTLVCRNCIDNGDFAYCVSCEEWFYNDDVVWSEKYQEYFCQDCFENIAEEEAAYCKKHHIYDDED